MHLAWLVLWRILRILAINGLWVVLFFLPFYTIFLFKNSKKKTFCPIPFIRVLPHSLQHSPCHCYDIFWKTSTCCDTGSFKPTLKTISTSKTSSTSSTSSWKHTPIIAWRYRSVHGRWRTQSEDILRQALWVGRWGDNSDSLKIWNFIEEQQNHQRQQLKFLFKIFFFKFKSSNNPPLPPLPIFFFTANRQFCFLSVRIDGAHSILSVF